jgi:SAM-dependent methyltransferase
MIAAARRRAAELGVENVEFHQLDAAAIPLADGSVDAVVFRFGIMLVPEPARALAEIARVLRPGGRAALAVWAAAEENDWMTAVGRSALELGLMERPDPAAPGPFRFADVDALRRLAELTGLDVVVVEDVPVLWRASSLEEWWRATRDMSPTLAGLLQDLDARTVERLRRGAEERLERHVAPDGSLAVPGLARALLAGRSPEA